MGYWKNVAIEQAATEERERDTREWLAAYELDPADHRDVWPINEAVAWLQEAALAQVEVVGGYPPSIGRVGSHVVIAELDHNGAPDFAVYCGATAVRWYVDALDYLRDCPEGEPSLSEAMGETQPGHCRCDDGGEGA